MIHLFSWRGRYYTININDIVKPMDNGQVMDCSKEWIEQGKTAVPTKSFMIQNMGPKIEDSDDEDSEEQKEDK